MESKLYENIERLLNENGMSVSELERKADLGNGTIRRWKESMPSIDKVMKVAGVFGVSIDNLMNGSLTKRSAIAARKLEALDEKELETIEHLINFYSTKGK